MQQCCINTPATGLTKVLVKIENRDDSAILDAAAWERRDGHGPQRIWNVVALKVETLLVCKHEDE